MEMTKERKVNQGEVKGRRNGQVGQTACSSPAALRVSIYVF